MKEAKILFTYQVNQHVALKRIDDSDAAGLFKLVELDRQELRKWMPWVDDTKRLSAEKRFINYLQQKELTGVIYSCAILVDGQRAGMIDIHSIDQQDGHGSIGYWLGSPFQGQGVMTAALGAMEQIAFTELNLHKLMLGADVANQKSRAIAERRHYHLDGIMRENDFMNGEHVDEASYSLLQSEWQARQTGADDLD